MKTDQKLDVIIGGSNFGSKMFNRGRNDWSTSLGFSVWFNIHPESLESELTSNLYLYTSAYGGRIIVPPEWDDFPSELVEESDSYLVQKVTLNDKYVHSIHRSYVGPKYHTILSESKKCRVFKPTPNTRVGLARNDFGASTDVPKKRYLSLSYGKSKFSWRLPKSEQIDPQNPWSVILGDIADMRGEFSLALNRFKEEYLSRYIERGEQISPEELPTMKTKKKAYSIGYTNFEPRVRLVN